MIKLSKIMLLLITLQVLLFSGCSVSPAKIVYIKEKAFPFRDIPPPKPVKIRVYNDDVELYKEYIKKNKDIIDFLNNQIYLYRKLKDNNNTNRK